MKCKNLTALFYRTSFFSMIINFIIYSCLFVFSAIGLNNDNFYWGILIIFVLLMPFIIFNLYNFIFFQKVKLTDIQELTLQNIYKGKSKRFVGFALTIKVNEVKLKRATRSIFTTSNGKLCVSNFKDQKVLVGYCKKTDEVVVIKLLEGEK